MCFDGDRCDVWDESTPKARKEHTCIECFLPIPVGDRHVRVGMLFEGRWTTERVHAGCLALFRLIDAELCRNSGILLGGLGEEIQQQDEDDVDPHLGMSTRGTLEWLWELVKEPYRQEAAT